MMRPPAKRSDNLVRSGAWLTPLALVILLSACATSPDESGTLKSLEERQIVVERDTAIAANRAAAKAAYQKFLEAAPNDALRPEALRRLGDLTIEGASEADNAAQLEFRRAAHAYAELLRAYPKFSGNDRVLYQMAHAYEQSGDLKRALETLDRLVKEYPTSAYIDEAQFRRGEILFTVGAYGDAEQAYRRVLAYGDSPYYERALYMRGWSLFKQVRLEDALQSFFLVLDRRLIGRGAGTKLGDLPQLTRAERELVDDTFRVVSLSLANVGGATSIPAYTSTPGRNEYEFRVYRQLAGLYRKQERVKDAADTLNAFARRYPTHPQAPLMQAEVIQIYQDTGFAALALDAKKEYVARYGVASEFRRVNSAEAYAPVMHHVQTHLEELARHYHAAAQKSHKRLDYQEAIRWYRAFLDSFPNDPKAPAMNFLLAELLFEDKHYADAVTEYERTAYRYTHHDKTAEAGYAALLAYAQLEKQTPKEARKYRLAAAQSALRFVHVNPTDARTPRVLTDTAEKFYALGMPKQAATAAQRLLDIKPPAAPELRRTAWVVTAHVYFESKAYDRAEAAYVQALALTPQKASDRVALNDRLAASIYKQGELARNAGEMRAAAAHFLRVGQVVPASSIRANADYDAAAALIALKDWNAAASVLENFQTRYPNHALQSDVSAKLAVVYVEGGQPLKAAAAFEALAKTRKDVTFSREALWQAAELYDKAGKSGHAATAYARYVRQYPTPLEPAIEARYRLIQYSKKSGQSAERLAWARSLMEADRNGGRARTDRTRYLGALSALIVAEPLEQRYRSVRLVEPLKKNLKNKKERMKQLLDAYGVAADYGVAEVATAATYHTADVYYEFSKALFKSQRPKGLKADELEQYNVLLEEQAYPFEEKAMEIHEINVSRIRDGIYDQWVKKSIASLAQLSPVRYAKTEKGEEVIRAIH